MIRVKTEDGIYHVSDISINYALRVYDDFLKRGRFSPDSRHGPQIGARNFLWYLLKCSGYDIYQIAGAFNRDRVTVLVALRSTEAWENNGTNRFYNAGKSFIINHYLRPDGLTEPVSNSVLIKEIGACIKKLESKFDEFVRDGANLSELLTASCSVLKSIVYGAIDMGAVSKEAANNLIKRYAFIETGDQG